jgi:hypothetical protein
LRCSGEPEDSYVKRGGHREDTIGRTCLCNGLLATAVYRQRRNGATEPPLVTSGDDLVHIGAFLGGRSRYRAHEVIDYLLGQAGPAAALAREPTLRPSAG